MYCSLVASVLILCDGGIKVELSSGQSMKKNRVPLRECTDYFVQSSSLRASLHMSVLSAQISSTGF